MMRENQRIKELLRCHIPNERLLENEPMSNHTSFKIGGPVDFLVLPETTEEIQSTVKMLKREEIPFMIIGNASNLIVRDKGIRGVVIKLGESYNRCRITGEEVWAQSGILLSRLAKKSRPGLIKRNGVCKWNSRKSRGRCLYECRGIRRRDEGHSHLCDCFKSECRLD